MTPTIMERRTKGVSKRSSQESSFSRDGVTVSLLVVPIYLVSMGRSGGTLVQTSEECFSIEDMMKGYEKLKSSEHFDSWVRRLYACEVVRVLVTGSTKALKLGF